MGRNKIGATPKGKMTYKTMSIASRNVGRANAAKQPRRHAKRRGYFVALTHNPLAPAMTMFFIINLIPQMRNFFIFE